MMTEPIPGAWTGLWCYLIIVSTAFLIALRSGAWKSRDIHVEALGTRRLGGLFLGLFIAATMLGPADAIGLSQQGYLYGVAWVVFPLGAALAQLTSAAFFVRRIVNNFPNAISLGDVLEERCHRSARVLAGLIVTAQAIAFSGVLILAGGQVLERFLGVPLVLGAVGTALFVSLYTAIGGFTGVLATTRVQFAIVLSLLALIVGGTTVLLGSASFEPVNLFVKPNFSIDHPWHVGIGIFAAYYFGELLLPAYSIRALTAQSAPSARRGFALAAVVLALWYAVITLAGSAWESCRPGDTSSSMPIVEVIGTIANNQPIVSASIMAITLAGILSLIHSTFDSFLNSGAAAFARDVVGGILRVDDTHQARVAKQAVVFIASFGIVAALLGGGLIDILLFGYTIWVPSLLVPWAVMLLRPNARITPMTFWAAVFSGCGVWYYFHSTEVAFPAIVAGLLANMFVITIGGGLRHRAAVGAS